MYFTDAIIADKKSTWNVSRFTKLLSELLEEIQSMEEQIDEAGRHAFGILRVAANVANGETVTLGSSVYEVDIINTDSLDDTVGTVWANTKDPLNVDLTGYTHLDGVLKVGDLIRIENEILKVTSILGHVHYFARGRCATIAASHAAAQNIFISDAAPTNIPVGLVITLTPAVFTDALVAEINALGAYNAKGITDNVVMVFADEVGVNTAASTETMAGVGNAWDAATLGGGSAPGRKRVMAGTRVPNAAEVTQAILYVPCPFNPSIVLIRVAVTATGIEKAWNGGYAIVNASAPNPAYVAIDNAGTTDWAATDTIHYLFIE